MKRIIPFFMSVFIVMLMTFLAEFFGNKEIIFPEIAAISVGGLYAPKFAWNTNKLRIFFGILICAVMGVAIVKFLPAPLWCKLIFAYMLAQIVFINSKTSFAPMISAMVLPVMLETSTPIYILSAIFFTILILIFRMISEKVRIVQKNDFKPVISDKKQAYYDMFKRTILSGIIIFASVKLGFKFAAAPPLLVAFTEFSKPECPARKKLFKAVMLITLSAIAGVLCRYILTVKFGISLFISAGVAMTAVLLLMKAFKMFIPPAGAIGILAMLIPEKSLLIFPICIFCGISLLGVTAKYCFGKDSIIERKKVFKSNI